MATWGEGPSNWHGIGALTSSCDIWKEHTELSAHQIAEEAMKIAGKMCIYTNDKVTIEEL